VKEGEEACEAGPSVVGFRASQKSRVNIAGVPGEPGVPGGQGVQLKRGGSLAKTARKA
jgi:hypothetical protein